MSNPDHFLAKKVLAHGQYSIIVGQAYALFVLVSGTLLFCIAAVLKWDAGVSFGLFLIGFWIVVSVILGALGSGRLLYTIVILPTLIRLYASYYFALPPLFFFLFSSKFLFIPKIFLVSTFLIGYPLYALIPQFFIARWLAKEVRDDTMEHGSG